MKTKRKKGLRSNWAYFSPKLYCDVFLSTFHDFASCQVITSARRVGPLISPTLNGPRVVYKVCKVFTCRAHYILHFVMRFNASVVLLHLQDSG